MYWEFSTVQEVIIVVCWWSEKDGGLKCPHHQWRSVHCIGGKVQILARIFRVCAPAGESWAELFSRRIITLVQIGQLSYRISKWSFCHRQNNWQSCAWDDAFLIQMNVEIVCWGRLKRSRDQPGCVLTWCVKWFSFNIRVTSLVSKGMVILWGLVFKQTQQWFLPKFICALQVVRKWWAWNVSSRRL